LTVKCDICEKEFESSRSMKLHRRWHDLPEYKEFQEKYREKMRGLKHNGLFKKGSTPWNKGVKNCFSEESLKKISESGKGRIPWNKNLKGWNSGERNPFYGKKHTDLSKQKMSEARKGLLANEKHPQWKGDNVSYAALHDWIKKNKQKPKRCDNCNKETDKLDCSNISGEYKRDINDFQWLCRRCHLEFDGVIESLIKKGKKTQFKKGQKRSEDVEQKRIESLKGHKISEETKHKISESLKEYHKNKTKVKASNETNKTHEKIEVYNN